MFRNFTPLFALLTLLAAPSSSLQAATNVDAMAANLNGVLSARVTGFSYAVVQDGQLEASQAGGIRKVGDAFTTDTQIHVASVSKTVTAVAVLQLLEANNLSVFDSVGPWLPDEWIRGYGFWNIGGVRFIDLLTHRSGVQQSISKYLTTIPDYGAVSVNSYDGLQELVANGIAADWKDTGCASKQDDDSYLPGAPSNPGDYFAVYCYKNANYGLFRILIPKLWQAVNPAIDHLPLDENLTAWLYVAYVAQNVWAPLDLTASCHAPDQDDKPQYFDARYPTAPPTDSWGDYSMFAGCGPVGWHLSSVDLAKFATYLSHAEQLPADEQILSVASRNLMDEYKLGWSKDSNSGANVGSFYHGGDYMSNSTAVVPLASPTGIAWTPVPASRESHACVIKFDDGVEAALVINSSIRGGGLWQPQLYNKLACGILIDAHAAARIVTAPGGGGKVLGGNTGGGGLTRTGGSRTTGGGLLFGGGDGGGLQAKIAR